MNVWCIWRLRAYCWVRVSRRHPHIAPAHPYGTFDVFTAVLDVVTVTLSPEQLEGRRSSSPASPAPTLLVERID